MTLTALCLGKKQAKEFNEHHRESLFMEQQAREQFDLVKTLGRP